MKKISSGLIISALISVSAMALTVPANHIVDAAWLKSHMGDKNLVIIDVRKKGYKAKHIKGAVAWKSRDFREGRYYSRITKKPIPGYVAAPLTIKRTMRKSGVNNDSAIVLYSGGAKPGDFLFSTLADFTCEYYGFSNVAILNGGLAGWKKAGGAVNNIRPKVTRGNFSFKGRKFNQAIMATGENVDEAVWTGDAQTLDANGKNKHWYGTAKDPRRLHEGHLKGAIPLSPKILTVKKDGVYYLGSKAFIAKKFKKAGLNTNKPIISYCNTGHLATGTWFTARYILGMGDKSRMYSGSMADYTRWPKRRLIKGDK
ncbi:MAG: rhodanese-like domain-containing protein [Sulfurospirillum sp.]